MSAVAPRSDVALHRCETSLMAKTRLYAVQQMPSLFDHLVGELLQMQ